MNDTTIQMIAQAIIANTKVIQSLIDALPHEVRAAVAEVATVTVPVAVVQAAPAPVAPVIVLAATPVAVAIPVAVVTAPVAPVTVMPPPPVFTAPAPIPAAPAVAQVVSAAPVPVSASLSEKAPFTDAKGLITFVMAAYKALGPQKGSQIQQVLNSLNLSNINDVPLDSYDALYAGVKALA